MFDRLNHRTQILFAEVLILGVVISMTRAFALANLLESLLWLSALCLPEVRRLFVEACRDYRVQMVLFFWGWVALTSTWSSAPSFLDSIEDIISWRKLFLVPMCFAIFKSNQSKIRLIKTLTFTASVYMALSWAGFFDWVELDRHYSRVLENHATQGVVFAVASIFSLILFARSNRLFIKVGYILLIVGFVTNLVFLLTGRSGYLFLVVAFTSFAFLASDRQRARNAMLVAAAVILGLFSSDTARLKINQAVENAKTELLVTKDWAEADNTSLGIRVVMWSNSLELISTKPLLGSGAGGFKSDYSELVAGREGWRGQVSDDPHQQYLHIAAEYGIIGLLLFLGAITAWLFSSPARESWLYCAAISILLGTMVNGFANGHFATFVEGRLVWIFVPGLLASANSVEAANWFRRIFKSSNVRA